MPVGILRGNGTRSPFLRALPCKQWAHPLVGTHQHTVLFLAYVAFLRRSYFTLKLQDNLRHAQSVMIVMLTT